MARQATHVEVYLFRYAHRSYAYLLLKRIPTRGGFWQPITGGVEKGEELLDAVRREVAEESGITNIKRIIENVHQFVVEAPPYYREYIFGVEIDPRETITLDKNIQQEHDDHRWCAYKEAMALLKWPGNKEGLKKLHHQLTYL